MEASKTSKSESERVDKKKGVSKARKEDGCRRWFFGVFFSSTSQILFELEEPSNASQLSSAGARCDGLLFLRGLLSREGSIGSYTTNVPTHDSFLMENKDGFHSWRLARKNWRMSFAEVLFGLRSTYTLSACHTPFAQTG